MNHIKTIALLLIFFWSASLVADRIILRNGRRVDGVIVGQNRRFVTIRVKGRLRRYAKSRIRRIRYSNPAREARERRRREALKKRREEARRKRAEARRKQAEEARLRREEARRKQEEARRKREEERRRRIEEERRKKEAKDPKVIAEKKRREEERKRRDKEEHRRKQEEERKKAARARASAGPPRHGILARLGAGPGSYTSGMFSFARDFTNSAPTFTGMYDFPLEEKSEKVRQANMRIRYEKNAFFTELDMTSIRARISSGRIALGGENDGGNEWSFFSIGALGSGKNDLTRNEFSLTAGYHFLRRKKWDLGMYLSYKSATLKAALGGLDFVEYKNETAPGQKESTLELSLKNDLNAKMSGAVLGIDLEFRFTENNAAYIRAGTGTLSGEMTFSQLELYFYYAPGPFQAGLRNFLELTFKSSSRIQEGALGYRRKLKGGFSVFAEFTYMKNVYTTQGIKSMAPPLGKSRTNMPDTPPLDILIEYMLVPTIMDFLTKGKVQSSERNAGIFFGVQKRFDF